MDSRHADAAQIDSPAWRLVQALGTLKEADGFTSASFPAVLIKKPSAKPPSRP